ncbi:superoxide dismutase family protein [Kribbella sp. NPDC026611]|uniref:superoxide dismutase family protein n=1 Tax=Kribbella sp. NPDC026611 TaxID=3154911 RepID=UPI0033EE93CD
MAVTVRKVLGATAVLAVAGAIAGPMAMAQSRPPRVPPGEVAIPDVGKTSTVTRTGLLRGLGPSPFAGARATLVMVSHGARSAVRLKVTGVGRAAAGRTYGAHLHTGPCVAGDGAAAGPHYNTDVLDGRKPPRVDRTREVWLDFTVTSSGSGTARTVVPFAPNPGDRSIVIHEHATDHHGVAGARLACLPVSWR